MDLSPRHSRESGNLFLFDRRKGRRTPAFAGVTQKGRLLADAREDRLFETEAGAAAGHAASARRARGLCRAWRQYAFFVPARSVRCDRAGAHRAFPRHGCNRHCRPQHTRRRGANAQRLSWRGIEAVDRLPARSDGRIEPARLPDRSRRLWPPVAAAEPRQDARRKGRVLALIARRRGTRGRHRLHRLAGGRSRRLRNRAATAS